MHGTKDGDSKQIDDDAVIKFVLEQLQKRSATEAQARLLRYKLETDSLAAAKDNELEEQRLRLDRLAATDMFVEKAQHVLTSRANWMTKIAALCMLLTVGVLGCAIWLGSGAARNPPDDLTTNALIFRVFVGLGVAGYLIIALRAMIALARSAFHEATVLRDRRHAMRFGRLAVHYFRGEELTLEDLEVVFNWNIMSGSSFLDIDANRITETVVGNLVNLKQIAEAISNSKGKLKQ